MYEVVRESAGTPTCWSEMRGDLARASSLAARLSFAGRFVLINRLPYRRCAVSSPAAIRRLLGHAFRNPLHDSIWVQERQSPQPGLGPTYYRQGDRSAAASNSGFQLPV